MNRSVVAGAFLALASGPVLADTPTFDFVQAGFVSDLSGSANFDGFDIRGNLTITDSVYLNAGYTNVDFGGSLGRSDSDFVTLGLGYKAAISETSVLFAQADYLSNSINAFSSGSGYQLGFGVRSNVWTNVELKVAGFYRDVSSSDTFLQLGTVYNLTDSLGAYLDIDTDFDDSSFGIGVRFSF